MAGRKRSNGEGSISYDKRRKRYRVKVTVGWELNEETGRVKQITQDLGSSYKTQGEAARALAEYKARPYDLADKNITFSQLYERWFDDFVAEHESHRYRIKSAYKYCSSLYNKKIRDITIVDMKNAINNGTTVEVRGKYKGQLKKASPSTKEAMKYLFNHLLQFATEARLIERNYAKEFSLDKKVFKEKEENRKVKEPFTVEELTKLWQAIDFVPFADMIVYACYSGWRPSEIIDLKIEDVDLGEEIIRGGIKTESGKNRLVPIHPRVMTIVQKYYEEAQRIGSKYLFNDAGKKRGRNGLSYDQYLTRFNNIMELLKFRSEITPHYTRHTFVTMAKSRDVKMDEHILKLLAGHKDVDLTEHIYTHREIEELKEEIRLLK